MKNNTTASLTQFQDKVLFDGLESIRKIYQDEPEVFAFIVRAANAHDETLEFLKFIEAGAENRLSPAEMPSEDELQKRLKAVIAKMEGK